jgi:hypothetical protein
MNYKLRLFNFIILIILIILKIKVEISFHYFLIYWLFVLIHLFFY